MIFGRYEQNRKDIEMIRQIKTNNTRNYQKELDKILDQIIKGECKIGQRLLLHSDR